MCYVGSEYVVRVLLFRNKLYNYINNLFMNTNGLLCNANVGMSMGQINSQYSYLIDVRVVNGTVFIFDGCKGCQWHK